MTEDLPVTDMRASDAERERIADLLKEALAEGRLGMDEFQERLDDAYRARTRGDLLPLVRDLPSAAQASAAHALTESAPQDSGSAPAARTNWPARIGGTATSRWGIAVLGGFGRKGNWTAPRVFTGIALLGGGELDLREARFEDREVEIRCFVLMGGMTVIVPPEVELEVRGVGIMGGFDAEASGEGVPGAPRVVVTGLAVWGGVGTERKVTRAEKKRQREERKLRKAREAEERKLHKASGADHALPSPPVPPTPPSLHKHLPGHPRPDHALPDHRLPGQRDGRADDDCS